MEMSRDAKDDYCGFGYETLIRGAKFLCALYDLNVVVTDHYKPDRPSCIQVQIPDQNPTGVSHLTMSGFDNPESHHKHMKGLVKEHFDGDDMGMWTNAFDTESNRYVLAWLSSDRKEAAALPSGF